MLALSGALAATAPAAAADPALAGHWPLDGSGADVSGNGNGAELQADTLFTAGGRLGQALDQNGDARVVRVPTSTPAIAALEPARVTVSAWVRDTESPGPFRFLVAKGGNATCTGGEGTLATPSYALATNQSDELVFMTWNGLVESPTQSPGRAPAQVFDGQWHHLAGVFDGTQTRLFADGVQVGDGASGTQSIAYGLFTRDMRIGSSPVDSCSGHFASFIDDVRVYGRVLADAEIAALAQGLEPPEPPGPPGPPGPAPPPPLQPPVNSVRPSIVAEPGAAGVYRCTAGTWTGAEGELRYAWRDLVRGGIAATSPTFSPRPADHGYPYVCAVTATNAGGQNTATSDNAFFTTVGLNVLPPPYGNLRVRGIDVFQTVQPTSGANMFGFPSGAYPSLPGSGTPTSLRSAGIAGLLRSLRPQEAQYTGVTLDSLKQTTAVVYLNTTSASAADPELPLEVTLTARRGGKVVGQPLLTQVRNPPLTASQVVTLFERRQTGVRFNVPATWLAGGALDLEAEVRFRPGELGATFGRRECEAPCDSDNAFLLKGVRAEGPPQLVIGSIQLTRAGQGSLAAPDVVLGPARKLIPGGERMTVLPYSATLDITTETGLTGTPSSPPGATPAWTCGGQTYTAPNFTAIGQVNRACRIAAVSARIMGWMATNPARELTLEGLARVRLRERYDILFAGHNYATGNGTTEPGWQNNGDITGVGEIDPLGPGPYVTVATTFRPLTAAAHELGHALSAPHADRNCGGNSNGQVGEAWATDNRGRLQGTAFIQPSLLGRRPAIVSIDDVAFPLYDIMSYCASNGDSSYRSPSDAWLSAFNWNRFFRRLRELGSRVGYLARPAEQVFGLPGRVAGAAQARPATRGVAVGTVGSGGGAITRIDPPDRERPDVPSDEGSPLRLRSLGAGGRLLLDAGARVNEPEDQPPGTPATFAGPVDARASVVELVRDGTVLDTLRRGAAPVVRLRRPRAGTLIRRSGTLTVRWSATGAGGGERRSASVAFSADGGRSWRTVFDGADSGTARIPGRSLAGTADGRVRVIVRDGIAQGRATSGRLRAQGSPPQARISAPVAGARVLAGDPVLLAGSALTDAGASLRGRSLRWFAGRRLLGSGERVRARLRPGAFTLRLVARDARGAAGAATLRVVVERRPLRIVSLRFPRVVAPGATQAGGTITVSEPAVLVSGRRRVRLGRAARRVRLALPGRPRTGLVRATYTLRPRGADVAGAVRGVVEVVRR